MSTSTQDTLHVVIAGGGVAALEGALALRSLAEERVALELLTPETAFTYRPLAVAEPFRVGEVPRFPLQMFADACGAQLRQGLLRSVDAAGRTVATDEDDGLPYEILLLALGARAREAVPGALTFRGPQDEAAVAALLENLRAGRARHVVFAVPAGVTWPLPVYELALLTRTHLTDRFVRGVELTLVTPEDGPLALFGGAASEALAELFRVHEIDLRTGVRPVDFDGSALRVDPDGRIETEHVVTLPVLEGPRLPGVPHDEEGFVPTDEFGLVEGLDDVYAAGDLTQSPVKQGGIATQQADAAATAIAARAGAPVTPEPFKPILRGLLLTGGVPRYLRTDVEDASSTAAAVPLWWPPAKIVGRYLAPFLAERMGMKEPLSAEPEFDFVRVEVELDD